MCLSTGACLTQCAAGVGFLGCPGPSYDDGEIIVTGAARGYDAIAPDPLINIWCATVSLCYAADQFGRLYASTDPSNPKAAWPVVYSTLPSGSNQPDVIVGVACPDSTLCLASDGSQLIAGLPPSTAKALQTHLAAALASPLLTIAHGQHGYRERFRAPTAGQLNITWYRPGTKRVVGGGTTTFRAASIRAIEIKLNAGEAHLLAAKKSLKLTAVGTFEPNAGQTITSSRTLRLTRS